MNPTRLQRFEAQLPAGSNAGICLFCLTVMGPVVIAAVVLRVLG